MLRLVSLAGLVSLASLACGVPPRGMLAGRALDTTRPVLVMAVGDASDPSLAPVEHSGAVVAATLRQALGDHGLTALSGTSRTRQAALDEARELGCGSVVRAVITHWIDSDRDWVAHPDQLGLAFTFWSVEDGATLGVGADEVELKSMLAARQSPFQLVPVLTGRLLSEVLGGTIEASDVPRE